MTGSEQKTFGWLMAVLVRTVFSLVVAFALCGSSNPFEFADQRLSFAADQKSEVEAEKDRIERASDGTVFASIFDPASPDLAAPGLGDDDPHIVFSIASNAKCVGFSASSVFVLANQARHCGSNPRAPPAV